MSKTNPPTPTPTPTPQPTPKPKAEAKASGSSSEQTAEPPPKTAPPPWHSVATAVALTSISLAALPTTTDLDEATQFGDAFCSSPFLDEVLLSPRVVVLTLATLRFGFAAFIFGVTIIFFGFTDGLLVAPSYLAGSKLKTRQIRIQGLKLMGYFTSWCWNLLRVSFFLAGLVPLVVFRQGMDGLHAHYSWLPRAALVTFEIAAPCALMVSLVVTHVLWPMKVRKTGNARELLKWSQLFMHNFNSILVLLEVLLLGSISLSPSHVALSGLFGQCYIVFSWCAMTLWVPNEAHALYFFLDTTLGLKSTMALLLLQGVLIACFAAFCLLQYLLSLMGQHFVAHLLAVVLLTWLVCRFR